jgi:hypothetical protein
MATKAVLQHDYSPTGGENTNIKVYIRARPPSEPTDSDFIEQDDEDKRKVIIKDPRGNPNEKHSEVGFQYDHIFWTEVLQPEVFESIAMPGIDHVLQGYNSCCFAYGQTGSLKTYSMFGQDSEVRGIIPRSVEKFFELMDARKATKDVRMVCSFLEIYNDTIRDLGKAYLVSMDGDKKEAMNQDKTSDIYDRLAGRRGNPYFAPAFHSEKVTNKVGEVGKLVEERATKANELVSKRPGLEEVRNEFKEMNYDIREDMDGNVYVQDLTMVPIANLDEAMTMINVGVGVRATHETSMNANSSRSHTVFSITIIQRDLETDESIQGCLNLVDLAGSERLKKTESTGVRLKEALHINTSLSALGKVIMSLDPTTKESHIPFRDSKLTRVLQNSLGGNSFTTVLASLNPHPSQYEECLSTLQFANRCRNVRNNPKVNYVTENEDKDRKIKRLQDEVKNLQGKLGGDGHGHHGHGHHHHQPKMSPLNIVALMKKMGIQAEMEGGAIVVNGKKMAAAELGLDEGSTSDATSVSGTATPGGSQVLSGGMTMSSTKSMNPEKMRRIITELQESNQKLSLRSKEHKVLIEEQGRSLQEKEADITKLAITMKHKDWEYKELYDSKDRDLKSQEALLKKKFAEETEILVNNNKQILATQQSVIQSVPETFRTYSTLLRKTDTAKEKFDAPLRKEFESHLKNLDESRVAELDNIKKQYEYWLKERDVTLTQFVEKFNTYREKKTEHLRQCEKEIVHLYEYTSQIEELLDGVEKGKYVVQAKQGLHGRSTTGATRSASASNSRPASAGIAGMTQTAEEEEYTGGVVIPKHKKPTNPLAIVGNTDLDLTKRIVNKHKERQAKLERVKEEAFHKSLHHASLSGTVTADVDPVLQNQIRGLLVTPSEARARSSQNKEKRPTKDANRDQTSTPRNEAAQESKEGSKPNSSESKVSFPPARDAQANPDVKESNLFNQKNEVEPTAWGTKAPNAKLSAHFDDDLFARKASQVSTEQEIALLRAEIAELKEARKMEQMDTEKIVQELTSNETIQYIRYLEAEQNRLHRQIKDISTQLHSAKVANASLNRQSNIADKKEIF